MKSQQVTSLVIVTASLLAAALLFAEAPATTSGLHLVATTANLSSAPDSVRFEILRWSTDDERDRLVAAWTLKTAAAPGGGKGGAKQGKGGAKGAAKGAGPSGAGTSGAGTSGAAPAGDGASATDAPALALTRALQETTTVGYLWSSEIAGYALRYAGKLTSPDGSQRVVLITQRRLGAVNHLWTGTGAGAPNAYDFSVIELRLNSKGEGEGKASIVGKVALDAATKMVTLEDYSGLPVVFRNVRISSAATPVVKQ